MSTETTRTVSATQAADWLAAGDAILIDVREPDEFREEHIGAAASLPLGSVAGLRQNFTIPENRKIVVHCLKGGRGEQACRKLEDILPAHQIYNLEGGITAWKQAGLPVVGLATGGPSIFRQVQMIVGSLVLLFVALGFVGLTPAFALAGFFGFMLAFAGFSGWCGLALLLQRMPWNRTA
ncbi:rhodanese-like domain-containing protein [Neorhizobium galegae]|uniref:rhodanese-like domain-containing protein n=1 Tax=Neorhizobium galegae TaxID=399 RepID=UPI000621AA62|nr:rhodanese-like domain-containing protein [Neorhizobium galegae]CDZ28221.1 Rhodanese-related sulfurtransferase [Neorhizobium galegae bv. officinalis]KAA9388003.1 rhodanese-like domain-containing protein [Neorhizobium galegae]KAB1115535.1 rhodanese-like domain-containing protein [Neorhizobium galegae]MCM2501143.1 rhodanese-like domain-containing protein [Neorhizobium galegae]MCQ1773438.1 rhodanese-like domain-containing protein [Neorhizobium galegae]